MGDDSWVSNGILVPVVQMVGPEVSFGDPEEGLLGLYLKKNLL